jgi:hypothetical protein
VDPGELLVYKNKSAFVEGKEKPLSSRHQAALNPFLPENSRIPKENSDE